MIVSLNSEREATLNVSLLTARYRTPQCAACKHCFLLLVKTYGTKLFPVANELILDNEVVNCKLALLLVSIDYPTFVILTSLMDSIGTPIS